MRHTAGKMENAVRIFIVLSVLIIRSRSRQAMCDLT